MASLPGEEKIVYNVLFVDDEENILRSIRRAVIDEEYNAYFANSGAEALKILEDRQFSVIVTDMRMPGMDGLQLLKIVKEKYPNIVKIVLSGFTQLSQVLATVNQADIFNFIAKPWDMETELKYVIDKAIEHYRLKRVEIQLGEQLGKRNAAYQTILKRMEISSALRGTQMQKIKKITELVVQSIDKGLYQESQFLATVLGDYTEKLPGVVGHITLENVIADLRLLISEKPYYENAIVQAKESIIGTVSGSTSEIYFAVNCLLTLLQQSNYSQEIYIYIVTKEEGDKATLSVSVFITDSTDSYQKGLAQCSYKVVEEVFREIVDVKFVTLHKSEKRILQLEFVLDKV